MGWTRTLRDKTGRTSEVASYLGASPPAFLPWSANGSTSGRVQTSYSANSSSSSGGSGALTMLTDQNSITRQNITDRLGRLKQVTEGGTYITQYSYDLLDDLSAVTQGTVVRNFTYSSLGRLLTADNPETRYGGRTMNYTYDDSGNLKTRTDTRLTVATLGYDALNRITSITYAGGTAQTTPSAVYCYDGNASANGGACALVSPAIPNPKGRLTSVSSSASTTNYTSFDSFGNILSSKQTTGGVDYNFSYTYNLAHTLTSLSYPSSGRVITYSYDIADRVYSASGSVSGGTSIPYAAVPSGGFAPHGAIQTLNLNNAQLVETTRFNARLQPLSITAQWGAATRLGLTYNYCSDNSDVNAQTTCPANNGNLWRQQIAFDAVGGASAFSETQSYLYTDAANRLTQASTSLWNQQNGYDQWGNRWVNPATLTGLPALTAETPQASSWFTNNRINTWTYDETGNVQVSGVSGRSLSYDAENRQVQANTTTYAYDSDGRRVTKAMSSGTTTYVYDAFGQLSQEYSTAPSTDSGTSYVTADHLGSTRLLTDVNGNPKKRFDYLPFGEELLAGYGSRTTAMGYNDSNSVALPDKQTIKFTSKERDSETGLDYFGARYMSSAQGRFSSPDPVTGTLLHTVNPQRWNMYASAMNNPLSYVDPNGKDVIYVNFTKEVSIPLLGDFGHAGIITVHSDGRATFSRFGSTNEPSLYGPAELRVRDLTRVQFGSNLLPTDSAYKTLAREVATLEGQDSNTVRMNYFRTSETDTMGLESVIQRLKEASDRGQAGHYSATSRNCAAYACSALMRGNVIPENAKISFVPNDLFGILSLIANENYSNGKRTQPKQPKACTSASDDQGNTLPKVCE
jgi:RHS repeat-associated protein